MFAAKSSVFLTLLLAASAHSQSTDVRKAIPLDEDEGVSDVVGPPTRAETITQILSNPEDLESLKWGIKNDFVSERQAINATAKVFPLEFVAMDSQLLPYRKVRIDVFMVGSNLHNIKTEFSVLSIDDQIRAIGLISSGSDGHRTPARRWEIYGVDKSRASHSFGFSPMPYAIMLSRFGDKFYSETAMHGTYGYGYGSFGSNASHGCIRQYTRGGAVAGDKDQGAIWPAQGYHRVMWDLLIPHGIAHADHLDNIVFGSWYHENDSSRAILQELRYKTTVFTHGGASLKKIEGWKQALESIYPESLIRSVIPKQKYQRFDTDKAEFIALDHGKLRDLYELERSAYVTPTYLRTAEDEPVQYRRRHTDWIDRIESNR